MPRRKYYACTCDRCGAPIDCDGGEVWYIFYYAPVHGVWRSSPGDNNLCESCRRSYHDWFMAGKGKHGQEGER